MQGGICSCCRRYFRACLSRPTAGSGGSRGDDGLFRTVAQHIRYQARCACALGRPTRLWENHPSDRLIPSMQKSDHHPPSALAAFGVVEAGAPLGDGFGFGLEGGGGGF